MNTSLSATSNRLLSLDVLRGITIAGMLLVNTPGCGGEIYAPLLHASWNGFTPTDLVFPLFMFIMGVSMYLSQSKAGFKFSGTFFKKIAKRSAIIFFIGMAIDWFARVCYGSFDFSSTNPFIERLGLSAFPIDTIRILGVLQRLALCSFIVSLIVALVPSKHWLKLVGGILVGYLIILLLGNGYALDPSNIIIRVDTALFGEAHLYHGDGIAFDPEGLLSTLPGIAHVLLGAYCGKLLLSTTDMTEKISKIFIFGTILLLIGWLLSYGIPVNKKIWTPSFVLVTCGAASLLLALLIWIIDIKSKKKWSVFFESFGVNPLFLYIFGEALAIFIDSVRFSYNNDSISIKKAIYDCFAAIAPDAKSASLLFSLFFVSACWIVGHQLYKRKIYIKL